MKKRLTQKEAKKIIDELIIEKGKGDSQKELYKIRYGKDWKKNYDSAVALAS